MEGLSAQNKILSILKKAFLSLSEKEIADIGDINRNTTRTTLSELSKTGEIQAWQMSYGSKNLYMYKKDEDEMEIKILVIGEWIIRNLDVESNENGAKIDLIRNCNLFRGVGQINYYDLRKICGIHQFHTDEKDKLRKIGVQRAKKAQWVQTLKTSLRKPDAQMWTSTVVYFDLDNIEYLKLQDYENQEIGVIITKFNGHLFDDEKPGWILDGQQRMWALEDIAINSDNPDSLELRGPITIGIGEFNDDNKYGRLDFIRKTFAEANATKNVLDSFRTELISTLKVSSQKTMTEEDQMRGLIAKIIDLLDTDEDSPFKELVDRKKKGYPKKRQEMLTFGTMKALIIDLLDYDGFKECLPIKIEYEEDTRFQFNVNLIKDYFNAIRFTFSSEWEKNFTETRIRDRLVLTSFANLIKTTIHVTVARAADRTQRFKDIVKELLRLSEDEEISFEVESPILSGLQNNKMDIKILTNSLKKIYTSNSEIIPDDSVIEEITENWVKWNSQLNS